VRRPIVCQKCAEFRKQSIVTQTLDLRPISRPASRPRMKSDDLLSAVCQLCAGFGVRPRITKRGRCFELFLSVLSLRNPLANFFVKQA
jgi:hypothetical protein